jgi:hypothetical protein
MLSKKDFGGFSEQIDSREEPNAQHRFKTLPVLIGLLRPDRVARTFSTASVNLCRIGDFRTVGFGSDSAHASRP